MKKQKDKYEKDYKRITGEKLYTRKEVIELLKLQIKKVGITIGRMPGNADDIAILNKIAQCKLIRVNKK